MDTVLLIKAISALIYPLGGALLLALLGLGCALRFYPRLARLLWGLSAGLLLLASNPYFSAKLVGYLERQYPQPIIADLAQHDAIIILGGSLRIPTPPAQQPQLMANRYWYAAQLYKAGKGRSLFIVGGNVFTQPGFGGEAYYARQLLMEWGIPYHAIMVEDDSRTTWENQRAIASLLAERQIGSALLVTSALHMPRAYRLFRQLPIRITPASSDVLIRQEYRPAILLWLPSAQTLALTTAALHELYGQWFYLLKNRLVSQKTED